jgi:hypothetical protein
LHWVKQTSRENSEEKQVKKSTLKEMNDQSTNPTKVRRKKTLDEVSRREDALKEKARLMEAKQQSELEGNNTVMPGGIKQFKSIVNEETSESASCDTNTESFIRNMEAGTP